MKGLIIAATKFEINTCIGAIKNSSTWQPVITGIGGVATAYEIMKAIRQYKPEVMIQAGIAGSFDRQFVLGSVVIAGTECFGDLGVVEDKKRRSVFDLNLVPGNQKPFKEGRLRNPYTKFLKAIALPVLDAVTVNEVTTSRADISHYKNELNVAIETMEGAAFHYVALMERIPFLQVRSLSNYVGERDKQKWQLQQAISNLNIEVLKIIEAIDSVKNNK